MIVKIIFHCTQYKISKKYDENSRVFSPIIVLNGNRATPSDGQLFKVTLKKNVNRVKRCCSVIVRIAIVNLLVFILQKMNFSYSSMVRFRAPIELNITD